MSSSPELDLLIDTAGHIQRNRPLTAAKACIIIFYLVPISPTNKASLALDGASGNLVCSGIYIDSNYQLVRPYSIYRGSADDAPVCVFQNPGTRASARTTPGSVASVVCSCRADDGALLNAAYRAVPYMDLFNSKFLHHRYGLAYV